MTWEELLSRFAASGRLSPLTIKNTRSALKFLRRFRESAGPHELETSHLQEFYREQRRSVSDSTSARRMWALGALLRWAVKHGHLLVDPSDGLKIHPPRKSMQRVLTQDEMARILLAPNEARGQIRLRDRAMLELLYGTGMRGGELAALDLVDIDLADRSLRIMGGKGKPRRVPFGERAAVALKDYLDGTASERLASGEMALFWTMSGQRMSTETLASQLRHYGKTLGLTGVTPHAFRRACATHLLENGANIAEIKRLLGHADINSTMVYTQMLPLDVVRSHRKFHPRAGQ